MDVPILHTKLYIPQAVPGELVARPRLTQRLDEALARKLTLISAPAGSGKTTLVSQWLADLSAGKPAGDRRPAFPGFQAAWLSLDEADNDPVRFWTYVIAALETVQPGVGANTLPLLHSPQPPPLEIVLTFLLNNLAALPGDQALVLEDYHLIENPDIHTALALLVDRLPPQLHLILTSRTDPPLPLARWRARGQLAELRVEALRFTPAEVALFLNQRVGANLTPGQVAALEAKIEGWAAGLQLAALSLQGRTDVDSFISAFTGTHHYILDYMTEEVLRWQPESMQTFLLQTSILERLTGPLCDAVTGRADSQVMLAQLVHANLFIVPMDDRGQWYRYHHLFADLLRHYLQQSPPQLFPAATARERGGVAGLHHRAATWYEQAGFAEEAIHHAIAAQDFEWARQLMLRHVEAIIKRGEATLMLRWLDALPEVWVRSQPKLNVLRTWLLFLIGRFDEMQRRLEEPEITGLLGETSLEPDEMEGILENRDLPGLILGLQAQRALIKGQFAQMIELSQQALACLSQSNLPLRRIISQNLASVYWIKGEPERAHQLLAQFSIITPNSHDPATALALSNMAELKWLQGQYRQAFTLYQRFLQEAAAQGLTVLAPLVGAAFTGLGSILYEWNDLAAAEDHLRQGIDLGNQGMGLRALVLGYYGLGRVLLARRNWTGAAEIIQQAEQLAHDLGSELLLAILAPLRVNLWLAQGDLAAVGRWLAVNGLKAGDKTEGFEVVTYTTLVRALLACGQLETAVALFPRLLRVAETAQQLAWLAEVRVLQALTFQAQNKPAPALAILEQALALVEPEGYIRTFVNEGAPMAALLLNLRAARQRQHGSHLPSLNYLDTLLAALGAAEIVAAGKSSPSAPLTGRELEVLQLLTTGLSSHDIAAQLVISPATLKTHLKNIYAKLQVNSRAQAVVKGKELNLC